MTRLLVYLGRLVTIFAGFLCAALAASAFLHLLVLGAMPWTEEEAAFVSRAALFSIPVLALFVANFSFIPAFAAILIAEFTARRDWLFFALAGGAVALATVWFRTVYWVEDGGTGYGPTAIALGSCAAGMVSGIAYWLIAGRSSGEWLHGSRPNAPGPSGS